MNGFQKFLCMVDGREKNDFLSFSIFFPDLMDRKMAGAKKVVKIKNQFFDACQSGKGIFEIRSYWCCIFTSFGQSFKWPAVIQEILTENW